MTSEASARDRAVAERFVAALVDEDPQSVRSLVRDDVVWWPPPSAAAKFGMERPLSGWDAIPWLGGPGWKGFEPGTSKLHLHHTVAEGDLVSVHYNRTATRVGGKPYDTEYNMLFRLVDGQIAEVWEIVDTATAFGSR